MGGISSAKGDGRRGAPANGTHGTDRTQYGAKNETPPYGQEYIGWTAGRQGAGASLKAAHNGQNRARERTGVLRRTPRTGKLSDDDAKGRTGRRERPRIRGTTGHGRSQDRPLAAALPNAGVIASRQARLPCRLVSVHPIDDGRTVPRIPRLALDAGRWAAQSATTELFVLLRAFPHCPLLLFVVREFFSMYIRLSASSKKNSPALICAGLPNSISLLGERVPILTVTSKSSSPMR